MSDWRIHQRKAQPGLIVTRVFRGPHHVQTFRTISRWGGWLLARQLIRRRTR